MFGDTSREAKERGRWKTVGKKNFEKGLRPSLPNLCDGSGSKTVISYEQ